MTKNANAAPILRLKGLRAERLLTQEKLAEILGISKATYNRKENGIGQFENKEIQKLLLLFEVKYEELFC